MTLFLIKNRRMNRIRKVLSSTKSIAVGLGFGIAVMLPIAAGDNYFELSKNLEILSDIYKELNIYYVDEVNPNELMRTGIDAMLTSLDPYTNYYSEAQMEDFRFQTTGKYGGIGAIIRRKDDHIAIIEPYENAPAAKAGLKAGDIILEVEGNSTKDKTVEEISNFLKGSPGTTVDLLIRRPGMPDDQYFTVEREDINLDNVPYYGYLDNNMGYIRLTQFTQDAGKNIKNAYEALQKEQSMKGLVLDLRGNPGGLLHEAVNICNLFIEKGKLVVSTKGKVADWNRDFKTLNKPEDLEIPIVVLINGTSASASEIVAGTLQDYDRAVVIGKRSFGKGLVQQTRDIAFNTKLKLTTAKYYTPSGRCIQAIDYSHRNEDGTISKIPDSLKNSFTTANGRTVYDGGGVEPDIEVDGMKMANVTVSLLANDLLFDYATQYYYQHDSIAAPRDFSLTMEDFEAFKLYLSDKSYDYETTSEKILDRLEEETKEEKYHDAIAATLAEIRQNIEADKDKDIDKFKEQIIDLLEEEIVRRYYYQNGEMEASFDDDPMIAEAIRLLTDTALYQSILTTP